MKKSDFTGWKDVFSFAYEQGVKQKAYKGYVIFMCILALVSMPAISLIQNLTKDEGPGQSEISTVTVYDETGLPIAYEEALADRRYEAVKLVCSDVAGLEAHTQQLENTEDSTEVLVHIAYDEFGQFNLTFIKGAKASIAGDDYDAMMNDFTAFFTEAKLRVVDVTQEQLAFINQGVDYKVQSTQENGEYAPQEAEEEGISMEEYFILLGGIMIVMFIISFSGSSIATSIVTEKSTRVVEYLMINVRPMALIVGKVLASLLMVAIQFAAIIGSFLVSCVINGLIFDKEALAQGMEQMSNILGLLTQVNPLTVVLAVIFILAGVLFFGILAGVAGATVSKMEEMAEGLKLYSMVMMVGSYIGIFLCIMQLSGSNSELLTKIFCMFPISSPFITPANLLLGNIGVGYTLIALVLLLLMVAVLFFFASRVYEALIFHNGKVLKVKDLLQLARGNKNVTAKEEK